LLLPLIGSAGAGLPAAQALTQVATSFPNNPQTPPSAPNIVFAESFDDGTDMSGKSLVLPVPLTSYKGSSGETYTAASDWLPGFGGCNGWILNSTTLTTGNLNAQGPATAGAASVTDAGCGTGGGQYGANYASSGTTHSAWWFLQQLAYVLGTAEQANGDLPTGVTPSTNNVISSQTNAGKNQTDTEQFTTTSADSVNAVPGHYYEVSAYFAAAHCQKYQPSKAWYDPSERLSLLVNGTQFILNSGLNPCSTGTQINATDGSTPIMVQKFTSLPMRLDTAQSLGMELENLTPQSGGNDVAFDQPEIIDVTPQLDKSFGADVTNPDTTVTAGQPVPLIFTITNSSELGQKDAWSFTDTLDSTLTVLPNSGATAWTNTCTDPKPLIDPTDPSVMVAGSNPPTPITNTPLVGTTNYDQATNQLSVTGSLSDGMKYCTVEVWVASTTDQPAVNGGAQITKSNGMWSPPDGQAELTVNPPTLNLSKVISSVKTPDGVDEYGLAVIGSDRVDGVQAGDTVTYTLTATNPSNVPVTNVTVADGSDSTTGTEFSGVGTLSSVGNCYYDDNTSVTNGQINLNPTGSAESSVTCTATYVVQQQDVDNYAAGITRATDKFVGVENIAVANGYDPTGAATNTPDVTSNLAYANLTFDTTPGISIVKTAEPTTVSGANQTVTYTFLVTNTGLTTLTDVKVTDHDFSGTGTPPSITSCTYGTTLADGKTLNPDPNAGNSDDNGQIILAPNETATCTADYTTTDADISAGSITNAATAQGTTPDPNDPTVTDTDTATVNVSALHFAKTITSVTPAAGETTTATIDPSGKTATDVQAGDTVTYALTATNSGTPTLNDVTVLDGNALANDPWKTLFAVDNPFTGAGAMNDLTSCQVTHPDSTTTPATNGSITLQTGDSVTCTATYVVQQADVDNHFINSAATVVNTAAAVGTDTSNNQVLSGTDTATVIPTTASSLSITKLVYDPTDSSQNVNDPTTWGKTVTVTQPNTTVNYQITTTNTGQVSLTVKVSDPTATIGDCTVDGKDVTAVIGLAGTILNAGQSVICDASYTVTAADLSGGKSIPNTATATSTLPDTTAGPTVDDTATVEVASLQLDKTADTTELNSGDLVTYTFTLKNTGSVPITGTTITDHDFTGSVPMGTIGNCTPSATNGSIDLNPGDIVSCTATYTVTQDDVNNYSALSIPLTNEATATGTANGATVTSNTPEVQLPSDTTASLAITKAVFDPNDPSQSQDDTSTWGQSVTVADPNTTVLFAIAATNTGNVTLSDVTLSDPMMPGANNLNNDPNPTTPLNYCNIYTNGVKGDSVDPTDPTGFALTPGQSVVCDGSYTVVDADITDGKTLVNTVSVTGTDPANNPVGPESATADINFASLHLVKTVADASGNPITDLNDQSVGSTVTYTFTMTNTGTVAITDASVNELPGFNGTGTIGQIGNCQLTLAGASSSTSSDYPVPSLAPGDSASCTADYTVTSDDAANYAESKTPGPAVPVTNTANATGTAAGVGTVTSNTAEAQLPTSMNPSIKVAKTADTKTVTAAGQTITYTITATNDGDVALDHVNVIDNGVTNGAGTLITSDEVPSLLVTSCTIYASADDTTGTPVGDGTGQAVLDPPSLAPGEHMDCPVTYTVTSTDMAAGGTLTNTASVTAVDPSGATDTAESDQWTVNVANLVLTKGVVAPSGDLSNWTPGVVNQPPASPPEPTVTITIPTPPTSATVTAAGDTVTYVYVVYNNGTVTIDNPTIVEDGTLGTSFGGSGTNPSGTLECGTPAPLAPGGYMTCMATYTVTQTDIDNGTFTNTAVSTGTADTTDSANGDTVTSNTSTATVNATQSPSLTITKSASPTAVSAAGQTVTYSFLVTNTGNTTLSSVNIDDSASFSGSGGAPTVSTCTYGTTLDDGTTPNPDPNAGQSADNNGAITLAPGETATCTAEYTTTDADITAGSITDTATVTGTPPATQADPTPQPLTPVDSNEVTVPVSSMSLTKEITTVALPTTTPPTQDPKVPMTTGDGVTTISTATDVPIQDQVMYTFNVTNTGSVDIDNVTLTDVMSNANDSIYIAGCHVDSTNYSGATIGTLPVGKTAICYGNYTLSQADVDAGQPLVNTASASGTDTAGNTVDTNTAKASVTPINTPQITMKKTVTAVYLPEPDGKTKDSAVTIASDGSSATGVQADDVVQYALTASNPGTVTMNDVTVNEDASLFTGSGTPPTVGACTYDIFNATTSTAGDSVTNSQIILAPGDSASCTATYTVTQTDVDNYAASGATVDNTATATGTPATSTSPITSDPSTATVTPVAPKPALSLVKSASPSDAASFNVGQVVTYSFLVTNTGNVTINDIAIDDSGTAPDDSTTGFTGVGQLSDIVCPDTTLVPEGSESATAVSSTTCTATYTIQQDDVDNGSIQNAAQATGTGPNGDVTSKVSDVTIPGNPNPGLQVIKTAVAGPLDSNNLPTVSAAGQTINYTITATNTGNQTLHDVTVSDAGVTNGANNKSDVLTVGGCTLNDTDNTSVANDGTITLQATNTPGGGDVVTCTATYQTTQADIDAGGQLVNQAAANGYDPANALVSAGPAKAPVDVTLAPALTVTKTLAEQTVSTTGDVTWTITATNSGNVTLSQVSVSDLGMTSAVMTTPAAVALSGCYLNDAAKTSVTPGNGSFMLAPVVDPDNPAPGSVVTCTATYTVTADDLSGGAALTNTATATGMPPSTADNPPVPLKDTATATLDVSSLALTKTITNVYLKDGTTPDPSFAGTSFPVTSVTGVPADDVVEYTFAVTNTGSVDVNTVTLADDMSGVTLTGCSWATLAPGDTATCTGTYTMTQADVDAGQTLTNTATASGTDTANNNVTSNQALAEVTPINTPAITMTKTITAVNLSGDTDADTAVTGTLPGASVANVQVGDVVHYTLTASNTGTVTLNNVTMADLGVTSSIMTTAADVTLSSCYLNGDTTTTANPADGSITLAPVVDPANPAPGSVVTCTATYTVTQTDIDNNVDLTNTAQATGTPANSATPLDPEQATATVTPVTADPKLTVAKTPKTQAVTAPGPVTWTITATNTGNVTLSDVSVSDLGMTSTVMTTPAAVALTDCYLNGDGSTATPGTLVSDPSNIASLAPNDYVTCTATYTVTQTDIDNNVDLTNTAQAAGTDPAGTDHTASDTATVTMPTPQTSLALTKTADDSAMAGNDGVGDTVAYTFTVTNNSNVTLSNIDVAETGTAPVWSTDDPANDTLGFSGAGTVPTIGGCTYSSDNGSSDKGTTVGNGSINLLPNESATCTATYQVQQGDVNAGQIVNVAQATGAAPSTTPVPSNLAGVVVPLTQTPELTLDKSVSPGTVSAAGNQVTYSFTMTNTGNVTLSTVKVDDGSLTPLSQVDSTTGGFDAPGFSGTGTMDDVTGCQLTPDGSSSASDVAYPVPTLNPGDAVTCTATYSATQPDVDAGTVVNTAQATSTGPDGSTPVDSGLSSATFTATQTPTLTMLKTATNLDGSAVTALVAGDTVKYSFMVTNTGNVSISSIGINDPASSSPVQPASDGTGGAAGFSGHGTLGTISGCTYPDSNTVNVSSDPAANGSINLAPGESATCTATYTVTQDDVDATKLDNAATASGTAPDNSTTTSNVSYVPLPASKDASIVVTKNASLDGGKTTSGGVTVNASGQIVTFTIVAQNTGKVSLTNVSVTDAGLTNPSLTNISGALTVSNCFVNSGTPGSATNGTAKLAPNDTLTCTATYTTTQPDIDNNVLLTNTATAAGTDPSLNPVQGNDTTATITPSQDPMIQIVKNASPLTVNSVDDPINYSFDVTNIGNVTLTGITVTDPMLAGITINCPTTPLAPNDTETCTATEPYHATQTQVDAGSFTNTATVTGNPPNDAKPVQDTNDVTVNVPSKPGVSITKKADVSTVSHVNDPINYTFTVTNTGNVTLDPVTVDDPMLDAANLSVICDNTSLAPGASTDCAASGPYLVSQDQIDAATVLTNTATATGTPPTGSPVTGTDTATVTPDGTPQLVIAKTAKIVGADVSTDPFAGEQITYTFVVTNSGDVTVHGISIDDSTWNGSNPLGAISCQATTLVPDVSTTCTVTYTVTQKDVDQGYLDNTATADGQDPQNNPVDSTPDSVHIPQPAGGALTVNKVANTDTVTAAGDSIHYTITAKNSGNVTLTDVNVIDAGVTNGAKTTTPLTITDCKVNGTSATNGQITLAPGDVAICAVDYTASQPDIDAGGTLTNDASATGNDPSKKLITSNETSVPVTVDPTTGLTVTKTPAAQTVTKAGDVTWTITATNTGSATANGVKINDPAMSNGGVVTLSDCTVDGTAVDNTLGFDLAPKQSAQCTATYTLTATDIANGKHLTNLATADGTAINGTVPVNGNTAAATVDIATLALAKTTDTTHVTAAGQIINYTITATNTGSVTLKGVNVADAGVTNTAGTNVSGMLGVTCPDASGWASGESGTLAPGDSVDCTATYKATQADIDAGGTLTNQATAAASDPDGVNISTTPADVTVPVQPPAGQLTMTKKADQTNKLAVGETVNYSFIVTNSGVVTINGIAIDDSTFDGHNGALTVTCPVTTLAPGASTTCTAATYTVTQADVNAGSLDNTAKATGTDSQNNPVTSPDSSWNIPQPATSSLVVTKTPSRTSVEAAGDQVNYTITAINKGNVTLTGVIVSDDGVTNGAGTKTALAVGGCYLNGDMTQTLDNSGGFTLNPGDVATCTATYTATQADIDAGGTLGNVASATGQDPSNTDVRSQPAPASVNVTPINSLTVTKTPVAQTVMTAGDVQWQVTATNHGSATLSGVNLVDDKMSNGGAVALADCFVNSGQPGSVTNGSITLAPGDTASCTATYAVTSDDVQAAAQLTNTANATGDAPNNTAVTSPGATATVDFGGLVVTKTADAPSVTAKGDVVNYTITAENTGDVTLSAVWVTDNGVTNSAKTTTPLTITDCTVDGTAVTNGAITLASKAVATCTAQYTVTQADIDANGTLTNTASATGQTPDLQPVTSNTADATVDVTPTTGLEVTKTTATQTVSTVGDVAFTITAQNTGTVTLTGVVVADTGMDNGSGALDVSGCVIGTTSVDDNSGFTLAPNATVTCQASYHVTQADIDAGKTLTNTANATGNGPTGPVSSTDATATVDITQTPHLTLLKTADQSGSLTVGEQVNYSFLVTNDGNVTVSNIAIDDSTFSGSSPIGNITCPDTTLAPNGNTTCTTDTAYTVTQADVDAGTLSNTATANGTAPDGNTPVPSAQSKWDIPQAPAPHVAITETANPGSGLKAGDPLTFTAKATNDGNVTLTNVMLANVATGWTGAGPMPDIDSASIMLFNAANPVGVSVTNGNFSMAPGDYVTYTTLPYTVLQADIDNGTPIVNQASVVGTPPNSTRVASVSDTATAPATPVVANAHINITETPSQPSGLQIGDTLTFNIKATNDGNVTLHNVTLSNDITGWTGSGPMPGLVTFLVDGVPVVNGHFDLAPGQSVTCVTTPYIVTAADVTSGKGIANKVMVAGAPPQNLMLSAVSAVTVVPAMTVTPPTGPGGFLVQTGAVVATGSPLIAWMLMLALGGLAVGAAALKRASYLRHPARSET